MNKEMEKLIQQMLYNMTKEEVLDTLSNIESPEVLYVYAYNYNWELQSHKCQYHSDYP